MMPVLKEKKRYLLFGVISPIKFSAEEVKSAVEEGVRRFLGELGLAKAGAMFISERWDSNKQRGLLKISHNMVDEVIAALILIKSIKNREVIFRSVKVTGTVKKSKSIK